MTTDTREKAERLAKEFIAANGPSYLEDQPWSQELASAISQALLEAHKAGKEEMREEAAKVLLEGYDRNVAIPYRRDGVASKNDQCAHGHYMYEDCEYCAASAIRNIT